MSIRTGAERHCLHTHTQNQEPPPQRHLQALSSDAAQRVHRTAFQKMISQTLNALHTVWVRGSRNLTSAPPSGLLALRQDADADIRGHGITG